MVIITHRKVIGVVTPMQVHVIFEVKYEDIFFLAAEQAFYLDLSWEPFLRLLEVQRA